jgi:hypothetical protein
MKSLSQFNRRRRIALWLGVLTPALLLIMALIDRHNMSGYQIVAFIGGAILMCWVSTRQYRRPFCGGDTEEDQAIPTFHPKRCAHCAAQLR